MQVTPYLLSRARRGGPMRGTDTNSDVGVDIKYSITPSLTLDLTYNTDFAQVEEDEQQLNLDRFNLFFHGETTILSRECRTVRAWK